MLGLPASTSVVVVVIRLAFVFVFDWFFFAVCFVVSLVTPAAAITSAYYTRTHTHAGNDVCLCLHVSVHLTCICMRLDMAISSQKARLAADAKLHSIKCSMKAERSDLTPQ